jgi:hypothetical protein
MQVKVMKRDFLVSQESENPRRKRPGAVKKEKKKKKKKEKYAERKRG